MNIYKSKLKSWLEVEYPLTIISDRYSGTYSKGLFLAFPNHYYDIPEDVDSDDLSCYHFWEDFTGLVGRGTTPNEALEDLKSTIINLYGKLC